MSALSYAQLAKRARRRMDLYQEGSPPRSALAEYILAVRDAEVAQERVEQAWTKYLRSFKSKAVRP